PELDAVRVCARDDDLQRHRPRYVGRAGWRETERDVGRATIDRVRSGVRRRRRVEAGVGFRGGVAAGLACVRGVRSSTIAPATPECHQDETVDELHGSGSYASTRTGFLTPRDEER